MRRLIILVFAAALAGCATTYAPIVDQPSGAYASDLADCRAHAQRTLDAGSGAAAGATIGAGLGLVLCSALGGRDCGRTAAGTAVLGAAHGAGAGHQSEAQVVRACLVGRGHRVLN